MFLFTPDTIIRFFLRMMSSIMKSVAHLLLVFVGKSNFVVHFGDGGLAREIELNGEFWKVVGGW